MSLENASLEKIFEAMRETQTLMVKLACVSIFIALVNMVLNIIKVAQGKRNNG